MTDSTTPAPRRGVPLWAQILIWVFLIGLLAIVAMGLRRAQQGTVQPGQKIENFALPLYSGYELDGKNEIKMEDLRGKVVVLNFWASWCKPCEGEAADLEEAWRSYQESGQVIFLGVDYVDTEPEARSYLSKFEISYPNGPDLGTRISQLFNRNLGVPETYIIDREGVLRYIKIGPFLSVQEVQSVIAPILNGD